MLISNLFTFILNYFRNDKLHFMVLFHCWNKETVYRFSILCSQYSFYIQYANLNDSSALDNFGYRYMIYNRPQIGVFMDLNCNHSDYFIHENSHQRLFNYHYNWLIFDELSNISRFSETFKHVNLSVDAQLTYTVLKQTTRTTTSFTSNETSFITFDVYNNGWFLGGSLNITKNYEIVCSKMNCQNKTYYSDLYKRTLYGNRESLSDITMRVAVVATEYSVNASEEQIQNHLLAVKDFHIDPMTRFGMQIFMVLKDSLYTRVSYTYYNRWSDSDIKGGIVGALIEDRADLSTSPFFYTAGRLSYLRPIAQTGLSRSVCMFRTPRDSGIQGCVFIDPFSTKVWISFIIVLALSAILLWVIFFVEFLQTRRCLQFVPSLLTTCLISFGSACAQGSFLTPHSMGGRVAFISLSLISFIMYNYYTSVVVSSLLGSPVKSKIKTLADLADSNLDVGLEPLPYTYTYLNLSTLSVVRRFVERKIETKRSSQKLWYSPQDGINKMRIKPGFVYIFEAQTGYYIIKNQYEPHEICDLNEFPFRSDSLLSTQLHKNSSYKEIVRLKIMRILETGVYSKHYRLWANPRLNCLSNSVLLSVGMEYAAPLFLMLLCVFLLALIIFLVEILWYRYAMNVKITKEIERITKNIKD